MRLEALRSIFEEVAGLEDSINAARATKEKLSEVLEHDDHLTLAEKLAERLKKSVDKINGWLEEVKSSKINGAVKTEALPEPIIGKIKLVDLSKLIDPSKKNNLMAPAPASRPIMDDSVVILSDSDEPTPVVTRKKNNNNNNKSKVANESNNNNKSKSVRENKNNNNGRPKRNAERNLLSKIKDSSSDTDDSYDLSRVDAKNKRKDTKKSKTVKDKREKVISSVKDPKFSWKCYVKLTRIPAEKLLKDYRKKMQDAEYKKLTNLRTLNPVAVKATKSMYVESSDSEDTSKKSSKKRNRKSSTDSDSNAKKPQKKQESKKKKLQVSSDDDSLSDASNKKDAFDKMKDKKVEELMAVDDAPSKSNDDSAKDAMDSVILDMIQPPETAAFDGDKLSDDADADDVDAVNKKKSKKKDPKKTKEADEKSDKKKSDEEEDAAKDSDDRDKNKATESPENESAEKTFSEAVISSDDDQHHDDDVIGVHEAETDNEQSTEESATKKKLEESSEPDKAAEADDKNKEDEAEELKKSDEDKVASASEEDGEPKKTDSTNDADETPTTKKTNDNDSNSEDDDSTNKNKNGKKPAASSDSEDVSRKNCSDDDKGSKKDKSSKGSSNGKGDDDDDKKKKSKKSRKEPSSDEDDTDDDKKKKRKSKRDASADEDEMKKKGSDDSDDEVKTKKKLDSDSSDDNSKKKQKKKKKVSDDSDSDDDRKKKSKREEKKKDSDSSDDGKKTKKKKKGSDDSDSSDDGKKKKKKGSDDSDSSDDGKKKKKKKGDSSWKKDKLLSEKLSSSEEETALDKFKKKCKEQAKKRAEEEDKPVVQKKISKSSSSSTKKRSKRVISDSDEEYEVKDSDEDDDKDEDKSSESSEEEKEDKESAKKSRKRIKRVKESSSDEDGDKSTRKKIRHVLAKDSLSESTVQAEKEEKERKARIIEKQKKYNDIFDADKLEKSSLDKVVIDFNEETGEELLSVDKRLVKHLKPHQGKGVQFMWDSCFESINRAKKTEGSGCILAHCMGLGKTLQVITLVHTLLKHPKKTGIRKVLVNCPLSTVLNWVAEFKMWLPKDDVVHVFDLVAFKQNPERLYQTMEWHKHGGVLVLGYDMFRNLSNEKNARLSKKLRQSFQEALVDPGPDIVICDEGHLLKNEKTSLSICMNRLRTNRRIVLTGTPLQNNMKEYWCMVQFVKPNLLGTFKEYLNRFVNPITNGQYTDSTPHDIQVMRKRSHVLHKLLDGVVQRRDYAVLAPFLPPKYEFVLFIKLTEAQQKLYRYYLDNLAAQKLKQDGNKGSFLFQDFQEFQRICTHPRVLLDKSIQNRIEREKRAWDDDEDDEEEGSLKDFIDDGSDDESSASSTGSGSGSGSEDEGKHKKKAKQPPPRRTTRATAEQDGFVPEPEVVRKDEPEWWNQFTAEDQLDNIVHSGKLHLLFEILQQCEAIGDKVLVFSQSLYSLNVIEYFLAKIDDATDNEDTSMTCGYKGSWSLGLDYYRLDGSSSCDNRAAWCKSFNDPENTRARLFLISTRAGGLGINLVAANRVVIFDVSWNPSHDIQSIYRVYRFGQTKPSYVYRFVTLGTMEMKIYERQVIKQAISKRVIDEQQIDRHYNQNDLQELYRFEPDPGERPFPAVPKDVLLGEMLQNFENIIYKYHEHQSLLENKEDEVLDEEERKAAWEEFENEKQARVNFNASVGNMGAANSMGQMLLQTLAQISMSTIVAALTNIVKKEHPVFTINEINGVIPQLVQELWSQAMAGETTMYQKVLREISMMQSQQNQKMQQMMMQRQTMQMYDTLRSTLTKDMGVPGQKSSNFVPNPLAAAMAAGNSQGSKPQQPKPPTEIVSIDD